jgi:L-alanine-DL-glutamate epimerase-like enolase superfamily enzyme
MARFTPSRREFLPAAAMLGGGFLLADHKQPEAAADDERKSAVLSKEATAVILDVAERHKADVPLGCGKDDDDNIRIQLRDCEAIIQACRKQKLHKIEFRGNLTYACSSLLKMSSTDTWPWTFQAGPVSVDRWVAVVNAWVDGLKEAGFKGVDLNFGAYPWNGRDKVSLTKMEKAIERIQRDGLRVGFYPVPSGGMRDFKAFTEVTAKWWAGLAERFQPDLITVAHEPLALSFFMASPPTLEQYTEFVKRTGEAVKKASPRTLISATLVPCTVPQELKFAERWATLPELEALSVDFYELRGFDRTNQVVAAAKAAGKRTFISETWRVAWWPKEFEREFPNSEIFWMGAGMGSEKYQPVDSKWIEMCAVYAAAWGMDAISPFWTQMLFKYLPKSLGVNMLDKASCREWAAKIKEKPEGFDAYKNSIHMVVPADLGRFATTLDREQLRRVATAYANCREAVGEDIDIAVHCHNEFDTPSACAIAKAVEPMNPLFLEDALNPPYSEAWLTLKRSTRIPLLTGEKLELTRQFRPFLDNQAVDIIHPDLAFAGGITGTRKIADYALLTRNPVALHNVGTLVLVHASAHFAAGIHNFYRSESALGWPGRLVEAMAASNPPEVRRSYLKVPMEPGLGVDLNPDFLRKYLPQGEPYWE